MIQVVEFNNAVITSQSRTNKGNTQKIHQYIIEINIIINVIKL